MELPSADLNELVNRTLVANDCVVPAPKEDRAEEDVFEDNLVSSEDQPQAEEQLAATLPMDDAIQEPVEDIFEGQAIKESLLFGDMLTEVHKAAWFMQPEDAPMDDAFHFP